jgi:hypothetical protein
MADFTDLELLQSQDRLWEMGTPGGAFVGGKPKKRSDYGKRTRTLADYRAGDTAQREMDWWDVDDEEWEDPITELVYG